MTEAIIIFILLGIGLFYTETIDTKKFCDVDDGYFLSLKEKLERKNTEDLREMVEKTIKLQTILKYTY